MKNTPTVNEKVFAREIWLNYFNDYLLKNGYITEHEHKKMASKIITHIRRMQSKG